MEISFIDKILPIINASGIPILAFGIIFLIKSYQRSIEAYKHINDNLLYENKRLSEDNSNTKDELRTIEAKYRSEIMEMESRYRVKIREAESHFESRIKEIHSEHAAYIREISSDYLYKESMMQKIFSESVNAISELQLRKANILCESKNNKESTSKEVERIDSAIKTLDELSELSFRLKTYRIGHIHDIELKVKELKDIIINLINDISDDKTKLIIIKFLTQDTNDIGRKLNSPSFPGIMIQNEEKVNNLISDKAQLENKQQMPTGNK